MIDLQDLLSGMPLWIKNAETADLNRNNIATRE
jgi:hypothetical protein